MRPFLSKRTRTYDIVPFIPARTPAPVAAEILLIFCTAFAGVSAALISLIRNIGAVQ